jgi:uncharacterized glyoxalase superfamily protein PhnB
MLGPRPIDGPFTGGTAAMLYIVLTDGEMDAHFSQAKAAGAETVMDLGEREYGSREYTAHDPESNL